MEKYIFTADITNSPIYPDIMRKISFMGHPVYQLVGDNKKVYNEFIIRHFNGGEEIFELEKTIVLKGDGIGGITYPIALSIDNDNNINGWESEQVSDIEFFINWIQTNKGMLSLFKLICIMHNQIVWDANGNYVGPGSQDAKYTFFDLKYFNLV